MNFLKSLNLLLLLMVLAMSSCKKDDETDMDQPTEPTGQIAEVLVTASINGTVVNEDGTPEENVTIKVGNNTEVTDAYGVFSFRNIQVNQNGAVVSAKKNGYFENTKVILTNSNKTAITKIMLIEKVVTSTFVAAAGGTAITDDGARIEIPAGGIKLESGGTYSGDVNVYATWLDPTATDLTLRMPGDLRGTSDEEEAVKLVTYGMIGVELEGDNGEPLNIADGQTATIEVPVPASLLGSAPATIPLWHFDEATGYWVEDGEGTLTDDNTYVGTVSHFSFWNFDVPHPLIHIEGTLTDEGSNNLGGLQVQISLNSNGDVGYGYTDNDGVFEGYVPQDEELTITVYDDCWDVIYVGQVGPFSEDAVIPNIAITNNATNFLTITGVLTDCNNDIESNGYVSVENGGFIFNYINVNSDGNFNSTISICDQMQLSISGISNNPFSQGTTTIHDVSGLTELNVGTLITCW